MIIRVLLAVFILTPQLNRAQVNLVPNGDFETNTIKEFPCSWLVDDGNINDYLYDWFTPIATTTDVMSNYADSDCWARTPNTGEGFMIPHSGSVMVGFINYSPDGGCQPNEWHEYLSVELTQPLTPGNMYCLEFYVALGANSLYATNNIGALFTTGSPENTSCTPIFKKPQVNVSQVVKNTTQWMRIELGFLADSAYRYLTLGNFFNHAETIIEEMKEKPALTPEGTPVITDDDVAIEYDEESTGVSHLAYYFIDDVKLYLCPSVKTTPTKPSGN